MKIIHVIPFFLPDKVAGTEIYCWSLCKYLQAQGIICEVVTPNYGNTEDEEYTYDNIKVRKYAEPTKATRFLQMGLAIPEGINAFKDYLIASKPDCLHFHGIYGSIGITVQHIQVAKSLGIPTIYTIHVVGNVCITHTLIHKQKELCDGVIRPRRCSACLLVHLNRKEWMAEFFAGVSNLFYQAGIDTARLNNPLGTGFSLANRIGDMRKNLERIGLHCDKVVVHAKWFRDILIANKFPTEKIQYLKQALPLFRKPTVHVFPVPFNHERSIKIVFAGRISSFKGVGILLDAMDGLPEEKVELSIYGQHDDDEFYRQCRKKTENKTNIHWRGILPHENVISVFRQHDALCLPSAISEMSPLVIQEAFAAGIPVIASAVYGNIELIIPEENGLLFTFKSTEDLRIKLRLIIDDPILLSKMKSQIQPPISFDSLGKQYVDIYQNLLVDNEVESAMDKKS